MSSVSFKRRVVVLGAIAAASWSIGAAQGAVQTPLDPSAFTSIGSISVEGGYAFSTGDGSSTPTLTADTNNGDFTLSGVISNGVAVFDFDSIDLPQGSAVTGTGSLPLALLSRSSVTTGAVSITVSSSAGTQGAGGATGGTGPGAGFIGSGAGYGGAGGASGRDTRPGATYGSPLQAFMGGSGGGFNYNTSAGGTGGGALEISAESGITLGGGSISANGAAGSGDSSGTGGGGGSGGGIFLASPGTISITGTALLAEGGAGDSAAFAGGGGGGGRILLDADSVFYSGDPAVLVDGGSGGTGTGYVVYSGAAGAPGTFAYADYVSPTPEPASITLLMVGAAGVFLRRRS